MLARLTIAISWLLLGAITVPSAARAGPALPDLMAGSDTVHVGDVFTIPISVSNVIGLTSFQFDLAFNPTIIREVSFTDVGTDFETAATNGGGSLTGITGFVDNTTGLLSGVADSISGLVSGNGLAPSGVIVDIQFQALVVGMSLLTLSNASLIDNGVPLSSANGDFMLQNGEVTVIGAVAVPEPGTLLLLSLALAFVFCIHRGRRTMKKSIFAFALFGAVACANAPVGAQITQNGPYYANPSWDQQIPTAQRFIVLSNWNNTAVLDRETGLVWQRSPDSTKEDGPWTSAVFGCHDLGAGGSGPFANPPSTLPTGNRVGWRLPSVEELASLADPTQSNPALPPGHPFLGIQNGLYWTATTLEGSGFSIEAYVVNFGAPSQELGVLDIGGKTDNHFFWCVRGGAGVQNPQ